MEALPIIGMPSRKPRHKGRFPWQRLALSAIALVTMVGTWRWATYHLYSLPEHSLASFEKFTLALMRNSTVVVSFFISGKMVSDIWTMRKSSDEAP